PTTTRFPYTTLFRSAVKGEGVGLVDLEAAAPADDAVLVDGALADPFEEAFPDAGVALYLEGVGALVPLVEVADDADVLGVRRPDREVGSLTTAHLDHMGTELVGQPVVGAFVEEVEVI